MKTTLAKFLAALALGSAMLSSLKAGTEILLYPLARAFGSPSESELVKCRQAFRHLQSGLATSRVTLLPVFLVEDGRQEWRPDLAEAIIREAGTRTTAKFEVVTAAPPVAPAQIGHNQLRYLWARAEVYSAWVKSTPVAGDYTWVAEIWGHGNKVGAIQVYLLDAHGQVAYCRLYNSHQFGPDLPLQGDAAIKLFVRQLFENLRKDPEMIFPPYGVG